MLETQTGKHMGFWHLDRSFLNHLLLRGSFGNGCIYSSDSQVWAKGSQQAAKMGTDTQSFCAQIHVTLPGE